MHTMDAIDRSFSAGYEQGAKDYKEQRDLVLQENAELVEKIEQLEEAVRRMATELSTVKKERDAKVVRCGEWIPVEPFANVWRCTACGEDYDMEDDAIPITWGINFCPACGADLRGEQHDT